MQCLFWNTDATWTETETKQSEKKIEEKRVRRMMKKTPTRQQWILNEIELVCTNVIVA